MPLSRRLIQMLTDALAARRSRRPSRDPIVVPPPVQSQIGELKHEIERRRRASGRTEEYDDVELVGRGARNDGRELMKMVEQRRLVQSSNVYAYYYSPENHKTGILYVTFLYWEEKMKPEERSGPGATYAYFDFPFRKFLEFQAASAQSAGKAVWDYCRVRGSRHEHQHRYYLVQAEGDYVPRRATAKGFARRNVPMLPGRSPRMERQVPMFRESTLTREFGSDGKPNRGEPNRGEPNRG